MNESIGRKGYVVDSNVIEDDPEALKVLSDNGNNQLIILYTVLSELDKNSKTSFQAKEALKNLRTYTNKNISYMHAPKWITGKTVIHEDKIKEYKEIVENSTKILKNGSSVEQIIFISTDHNFLLKIQACGLPAEIYKNSNPYLGDSQRYSGTYKEGTVPDDMVYVNGFEWKGEYDPPYVFHRKKGESERVYPQNVWGITPNSNYQNMAMYLMLHPDIPLVTIQSVAGLGKTYLALAAAFSLMFDPKYKELGYQKIFITKATIEIGESLGFLPGSKEEKLNPYVRNILDLVFKLHEKRSVGKIFKKPKVSELSESTGDDSEGNKYAFRTNKFEVLPLNYIRGMNIDNAIVIIDEPQNLTRGEMRTLLTRMGQNVKCFCVGDTSQVDNPACDEGNNGLNWVVRALIGEADYAHLVLKGQHSRGRITDMCIKCKL
jgi:PhoH-like ATPase